MRAASQASLAKGRAVVEGANLGEDYLALAQEFFAVSDLLAAHSSLVRALTSPSRDAQAKQKLAHEVFTNHVSPLVLNALEVLAANRWSHAGDIVAASEDLGIVTIMVGTRAAGALPQLEDEIFSVAEFLTKQRQLRIALSDTRRAHVSERVKLAEAVFGHSLSAPMRCLLDHVVATVAHGRIYAALISVGRAASRALATQMVIVEAAREPSQAQLEHLRAALARRYNASITMNVRINPQLIGGIRVHIGADVIEGSLAAALATTRRALAGTHR